MGAWVNGKRGLTRTMDQRVYPEPGDLITSSGSYYLRPGPGSCSRPDMLTVRAREGTPMLTVARIDDAIDAVTPDLLVITPNGIGWVDARLVRCIVHHGGGSMET
jgi:hypothetical protein